MPTTWQDRGRSWLASWQRPNPATSNTTSAEEGPQEEEPKVAVYQRVSWEEDTDGDPGGCSPTRITRHANRLAVSVTFRCTRC